MITFKEPVALLTDIHANEEGFKAILEDIEKTQIKHIFSLGDLVGLGPNPSECINLAIEHSVVNILGNNDYYNLFPLETYKHFRGSSTSSSYLNARWTKEQLSEQQIKYLKKMPPSLDIIVNGKLIGLCHFPTDCRYYSGAVWVYSNEGPDIFQRTNTELDEKYSIEEEHAGVIDAKKKPLFNGKTTDQYHTIIHGHFHFERFYKKEKNSNQPNFLSLNASGVAIEDETIYYIIEPHKKSFKLKRVEVPYDKDHLHHKLKKLSYPNKATFIDYIT